MSERVLPLPTDGSADALADWVEGLVLFEGRRSLNETTIDARAKSPLVSAPAISLAIRTINRRGQLIGSDYPVRTMHGGVAITSGEIHWYAVLLLLSAEWSPFRLTVAGRAEAATLFEELVQAALPGLLTAASQSVRFGWPSAEGRPQDFPGAIRWLGEKMGVDLGTSYRPPRRQDGGVDVVAWRSFGDHQRGFPVMLVQCSLERDFIDKSRDIDLRTWSGWLAFDTDPLAALAVPHVLANREAWNEMAARVIVLDRIRLAQLLRDSGAIMTGPIKTWADGQVAEIQTGAMIE